MAASGLNGPYALTDETIDKTIANGSAGAYALGHSDGGTFYISYVGRRLIPLSQMALDVVCGLC